MGYTGRGRWCCETTQVLAWPNGPPARRAGAMPSVRDGACVVRPASAEVREGNDCGPDREGGDKHGCDPGRPATRFERLSL